jgi:hypothetical protein
MRRLLCAAILLFAGFADAQSPVNASVSADRAAVSETFYIEVSGQGGEVSEPDMQAVLKDTGIQTGRPTQRMQTNIANINGRVTTEASKTWRYPARATKEGTITIPRIPVVVDGQERFTLPMQIRVSQAAVAGPQDNGAGNGGQTLKAEQLAFIESSVDKVSPYQGEAVTLSLRIYAANDYGVQIVGPRTMPMPETQGFYSGPQQQSNRMETRNGISYRVMEITVMIYPTVSGALTIKAWSWKGEATWRGNQFMRPQAEERDFLAPAIPINVLPLPDRPDDFSGAVGKYRVKGVLGAEKLVQGVPVTLTVTVTGEGNPDAIGAPKIPAISWAHVSGPEIDLQQPANAQEASKVFRYTLTPLEIGEQVLPPVNFVYFAPVLKNYKTETTPETKVAITASPDAMALVTAGGSRADARSSVELLNEGLLPILDTPTASLRPSVATKSLAWTAALGALIVPPILYGIFLLLLRHRRRLTGDVRYARLHFALSRYRGNMERLSCTEDPGEALYRALAGYLSDTYNTVEAGLTSQDARELLLTKGTPTEAINTVVSVLRACERARYSGGKLSPEEVEALSAATELAVGQLQSGQRKGGGA